MMRSANARKMSALLSGAGKLALVIAHNGSELITSHKGVLLIIG